MKGKTAFYCKMLQVSRKGFINILANVNEKAGKERIQIEMNG